MMKNQSNSEFMDEMEHPLIPDRAGPILPSLGYLTWLHTGRPVVQGPVPVGWDHSACVDGGALISFQVDRS